jgi:pimeloyl-ACP methyl ester carboxylesterase
VLHGERRGDSDSDGMVGGLPLDQLVFNLRNPDSARDTPIQGALDQLLAVRLAAELPEATSPEPAPTRLDAGNLFFFGHSQGGQSGALFLGYEPLVRAAVISGAGGNLIQALLAKSKPTVDVGGVPYPPHVLLQAAFQERPDRPLTDAHPLLALFNTFVNRSDADATSLLLRRAPADGVEPKHLLMYIGYVDSYVPLRTAGSLAIGAGLQVARPLFTPPCDAYAGDEREACGWVSTGFLPEVELPASGNVGGETAVALTRRATSGKDGHYVAFTAGELDRIIGFFVSARDGAVPIVAD